MPLSLRKCEYNPSTEMIIMFSVKTHYNADELNYFETKKHNYADFETELNSIFPTEKKISKSVFRKYTTVLCQQEYE